jgi:hypothetical protein
MISADYSQKKHHIGRIAGEDSEAIALYSNETIAADNKAFLLKLRDTVRSAVDIARFSQVVEQMRELMTIRLGENPVKTVDVTAKHLGLSQGESGSVLTHLIQGGDLSGYGLLNAVTRTAQDVESYDRATELEIAGSKVLGISKSTWREIAFAQ